MIFKNKIAYFPPELSLCCWLMPSKLSSLGMGGSTAIGRQKYIDQAVTVTHYCNILLYCWCIQLQKTEQFGLVMHTDQGLSILWLESRDRDQYKLMVSLFVETETRLYFPQSQYRDRDRDFFCFSLYIKTETETQHLFNLHILNLT